MEREVEEMNSFSLHGTIICDDEIRRIAYVKSKNTSRGKKKLTYDGDSTSNVAENYLGKQQEFRWNIEYLFHF